MAKVIDRPADPLAGLTPEVLAAIQAQLNGGQVVAVPAGELEAVEITNPAHIINPVPVLKVDPKAQALTKGTRKSGFLSNVDLSGVEAAGMNVGGLLPEDLDYEAEIIEVERTTSNNGNDMIEFQKKITFPLAFAGRRVYDQVMTDLPGYPRERLKSLFAACDLVSEDGARITAESEQDLLNNVVRFRIKNEEYNGKTNPKVNGGYAAAFETPGLA